MLAAPSRTLAALGAFAAESTHFQDEGVPEPVDDKDRKRH